MKSVLFALPQEYAHPGIFRNPNYLKYSTYSPIGLMYIASVIENLGHKVEIIDLGVFDYSDDYIIKKIHSADSVDPYLKP